MRLAVTAEGITLDAPASPVFGRCPTFLFVDTETMAVEPVDNPAVGASGGAGIQAAQFIVEQGAQALITGNVGPNALPVFQSAEIPVYLFHGCTVREAVDAFAAGELPAASSANVEGGRGQGPGPGPGGGTAGESGAAPGTGDRGGRGRGRGRGMGLGGGGRGRGMGLGPQGAPARLDRVESPPTDSSPPRRGSPDSEELEAIIRIAKQMEETCRELMDQVEKLKRLDEDG